jgi:flagellar assembly factor FliW
MVPSTQTWFDFPVGIPGFEEERRFTLGGEQELAPVLFLNSIREDGPRFLCLPAEAVAKRYSFELSEEDAGVLGVPAGAHWPGEPGLLCAFVMTVHGDGEITANMLAPVVLSLAGRRGVQSIQPAGEHSCVHRVGDSGRRATQCS